MRTDWWSALRRKCLPTIDLWFATIPSIPGQSALKPEPTKMTSTGTKEPGIHKLDVWQPPTKLSEGDLWRNRLKETESRERGGAMAMASTVQIMAKRIPLIKFPKRTRLGTPAATAAGEYCRSPMITAYIALAMKFVVQWLPIHSVDLMWRVAGYWLSDSSAKTSKLVGKYSYPFKSLKKSWFGREFRPTFGPFIMLECSSGVRNPNFDDL